MKRIIGLGVVRMVAFGVMLFLGCALLPGCGDPPAAPTGLTVTSTAPVTLSWHAVSRATGYNVYRGTVSGALSSKTRLASGVSGTTYEDTTAQSGSTYYYQVTAKNDDGSSGASNEVRATSTYQSGSFSLVGTAAEGQVSLSWNAVSGSATYAIYRGTTTETSRMLLIQSAVTATTVTDTAVAGGTTYYYQVVAYNAAGEELQRSAVSTALTPLRNGA